jgi:glutathione S-transferase
MLCLIIVADIQPVQNLRVLKKVTELADAAASKRWACDTITNGFVAFEKEIAKTAGKYCFGDTVTMADACLIPQVYNANR